MSVVESNVDLFFVVSCLLPVLLFALLIFILVVILTSVMWFEEQTSLSQHCHCHSVYCHCAVVVSLALRRYALRSKLCPCT